MKNLLMIALLVSSTNVFASKLANINSMTNTVLDEVSNEIHGISAVTHSSMKKVLVLKGTGKTAQEVRENAVAQALHTVCPFFDEGVEIGKDSNTEKGAQVAAQTFLADYDDGEENFNILFKSLRKAHTQTNVEIYSGNASGNNTVGNVLGIYDLKNNEIAVFANTNCGSDD